jgi:DNA-binding GntR family transcriptional regulator
MRDLRDAIVNREYKPGERVTEAMLFEKFKVSRTPVGEALNQLKKEAFIKIIPAPGAKVVKLSLKDTLDIYDILIILEGLFCRLACGKIIEDQITKMEEYNYLFERVADQQNAQLLFEFKAHFHWLITAAKYEFLSYRHAGELPPNARLHCAHFSDYPGQCQATLVEHKHIYRSCQIKESCND